MKKDNKKMTIKEFAKEMGCDNKSAAKDTLTVQFGSPDQHKCVELEVGLHLTTDEASNYIASLLNIIFAEGEYHPEFYTDAIKYLFFKFFIKNVKAPTKKVDGETVEDTDGIIEFMTCYSIINTVTSESSEFTDEYCKLLQHAQKAIEHKKRIIENLACTEGLIFKIQEIQTVIGSRIELIEDALNDGTLEKFFSVIGDNDKDLTE